MFRSTFPSPGSEPCPVTNERGGELPLLDVSVLRDLEDQVMGPLARAFVRDYVNMWDDRLSRLADALADEDATDDAIDAAISVKVSSAMVGARRLAAVAAVLEEQIRHGTLVRGGDVLAAIAGCGQLTIQELGQAFRPGMQRGYKTERPLGRL